MTLSIITIQHNGTQHNDIQHNDTQHSAEHCCTECWLCRVSFMLSVTYKPFIPSVIMLNVTLLSVIMLNVTLLSVIMLNVAIMSAVMLSVVTLNLIKWQIDTRPNWQNVDLTKAPMILMLPSSLMIMAIGHWWNVAARLFVSPLPILDQWGYFTH